MRKYLAILVVLAGCGGDSPDPPPTVSEICKVEPPAALAITTDLPGPIDSKSVRRRATIEVEGKTLAAEARGRGNSTWGMPKKPYRFKLDEAASLLGMVSDRDWVLLANYSDKTMLRTVTAWCLGRLTGAAATPESRFVELTLNGEYQGLYQLTWQMEVADHRIPAGDGFLAEIDARRDGDIVIESKLGIPYVVDEGMEGVAIPAIEAMEAAMVGGTWASSVDTKSLAAFYLVSEISKNNDVFWLSTYLFQAPGQKIKFGPLWDFDIAFGNVNYSTAEFPEGWWPRQIGYVGLFFNDPVFAQEVKSMWRVLSPKIPEFMAWIDATAATLDAAQKRNFERWPILGVVVWPNPIAYPTYGEEVDRLKDWLKVRADWLDEGLK